MPLNNPPIIVQDEGTTQGAVNTINFTGSGVTATVSGNVATISVTSGSSSATIYQIEIDFGLSPTRSKTFTIIDSNVNAGSFLIITQSGAAATGRQADENEMDPIVFSGTPATGQFILNANALNGPVAGKYKVNYMIG